MLSLYQVASKVFTLHQIVCLCVSVRKSENDTLNYEKEKQYENKINSGKQFEEHKQTNEFTMIFFMKSKENRIQKKVLTFDTLVRWLYAICTYIQKMYHMLLTLPLECLPILRDRVVCICCTDNVRCEGVLIY